MQNLYTMRLKPCRGEAIMCVAMSNADNECSSFGVGKERVRGFVHERK